MGADPAAGMCKRIGLVDLAHGLFEIVLPDCANVFGRIHMGRAGIVAHATLHAARGLDNGLLFVITLHDFIEVVATCGGLQLGHGLAYRVDQVVFFGLVPAFAEIFHMHALWVGQDEVAGEFLVRAGMHVLA